MRPGGFIRAERMAIARARLADLEGLPVRDAGELADIAAVELVALVAELQAPTVEGVAERTDAALNIAAAILRRHRHREAVA